MPCVLETILHRGMKRIIKIILRKQKVETGVYDNPSRAVRGSGAKGMKSDL